MLLPVAPFTETAGSFVNAEGRLQSFHGVSKPLGETRPAWKVLRVLGNLLGLAGFEQQTIEEVRAEAIGDASTIASRLGNRSSAALSLERRGLGARARGRRAHLHDRPARAARAVAAAHGRRPAAGGRRADGAVAPARAAARALACAWRKGRPRRLLPAREEPTLDANTVRVPAGHEHTSTLGAMFGPISIEKA